MAKDKKVSSKGLSKKALEEIGSATNPTAKELLLKTDKQQAEIIKNQVDSKTSQLEVHKKIDKILSEFETGPVMPKPTDPPPPPGPITPPLSGDNPYLGAKLYINNSNNVKKYLDQNPNSPDAPLLKKIVVNGIAIWVAEWSGNVYDAVTNILKDAQAQGATLVQLVTYYLPGRDLGSYSKGGAPNDEAYLSWIGTIEIAVRRSGFTGKVVVQGEPDALGHIDGMKLDDLKTRRYNMLRTAIEIFKQSPNIYYYQDASMWVDPKVMASRLKNIGATRFTVNTSGFQTMEDCYKFADETQTEMSRLNNVIAGIMPRVGAMTPPVTYTIDTSRNGNGPSSEQPDPWCNPTGRALGPKPLTLTHQFMDANIWCKVPGESDGTCRGGPNAGELYLARAIEMSKNAKW